MGRKLGDFFLNFWTIAGIIIIVGSYYYIALVSVRELSLWEAAAPGAPPAKPPRVTGPIHITEDDYLLHYPDRCRTINHPLAKKSVLFLITNLSKNHYARNALRLSWAIQDIDEDMLFEAVYVMGVPKTSLWQDQRIWHNEFGELSRESDEYEDLLLVDFVEDYNNVSFKVAAGLHYATHFCKGIDLIVQVHDDVMIRRDHFIPYLMDLPSSNFIGGDCAVGRKPNRDPSHKLHVPYEDFAGASYEFPVCYGSAVIMTPDIALKLYEQTKTTPYFPRDDVYLGHLMKDAGITPVAMPNVRHEVSDFHYCKVRGLLMLQPVPIPRQKELREEHERFEDDKFTCPA